MIKFAIWNVQGIRPKNDIIASDSENLGLDIVALIETKKEVTGTNIIGEYIHIFTEIPEENRVGSGASVLTEKNLMNGISNWEAIDENILKLNILIHVI